MMHEDLFVRGQIRSIDLVPLGRPSISTAQQLVISFDWKAEKTDNEHWKQVNDPSNYTVVLLVCSIESEAGRTTIHLPLGPEVLTLVPKGDAGLIDRPAA